MATRIFGDLSPDAVNPGYQGLAVGIQRALLDHQYENKLHPLYPSVDDGPIQQAYQAIARYAPPAPLPWGTGGGPGPTPTRPTTGQLYPY